MQLTIVDETQAVEFTEGEVGYVGLTLKECSVLEMAPGAKEGLEKLHSQLTAAATSTILTEDHIQLLKKLLVSFEEAAKPGSTVHMLLQDSLSIIESAAIMLASVER